MKFISIILIISTLFGQFVFSQDEITTEEVYNHIEFLASDSLKGRFPGTDESKVVANYILNDFKKSGLIGMFNDGFQNFDISIGKKIENISLSIDDFKSKYIEEYDVLGFSPSGKVSGKVVFVGWGFDIKTDKFTWNDYENVDVKDKWVLVFRGKPDFDEYPSSLFNDGAKEYDKVLLAKDKGAIGVIFINSFKNNPDDELIIPCNSRVTMNSTIPAFSVKQSFANRIFKKVGKNLKTIEEKISNNSKPNSFDIDIIISSKLKIEPNRIKTQNVVALLTGSDENLKDEYIVIGAHYDHLGFGGCGSGSRMPDTIAIHNGADDNASGVAGILELAEYLSAHKDLLKRSVIFIAFGAEERGLLGSSYFVENLPVPKESIYAMLNLDMVGKSSGKLDIMGTGTAKEFENILATVKFDSSKFEIKPHLKPQSGSDHASFYKKNIPVMFFFSSSFIGYHTPFDDIDEINAQGEVDVLDYIAKVAIKLSNSEMDLTFVKSKSQTSNGKSYGTKVKLGIIPSFEESDGQGFKISGVTSDSPAQKAGMTENDIITAINNEKVNNIYDYMARMKKVEPGDLISVEIIRNKKTIKLNIQL